MVHEAMHVKQASELPFDYGRSLDLWIPDALLNPEVERQAYLASWGATHNSGRPRTVKYFNVFLP
jgi:hypothetical protein